MFGWARRHVRTAVGAALVAGGLGVPLAVAVPTASAATQVTLFVRVGATGSTCTAQTAAHACNTIAQAVEKGEFDTGDMVTVTVGAGTFATHFVTVNASSPASFTIKGAGPGSTIVDANHEGTEGVFYVVGNPTSVVTLRGLTIENGHSTGTGGGVTHECGSMTLATDVLAGNTSTFSGGGVYNTCGPLTLTHDTLEQDTSDRTGGGLYASESEGTAVSVTHSTFVEDTASLDGGGVYVGPGNMATLTDDTFFEDAAFNGVGGGVASDNGYCDGQCQTATAVIDDTFETDLAAYGGGGAAAFTADPLVLRNSIFDRSTCTDATSSGSSYNVMSTTSTSCDVGGPNVVTSPGGIDLAPSLQPNTSTGPETLAITPSSAAFQEVPAAACTIDTDERTKPRPGVAPSCDAGAYEFQATLVVGRQILVKRISGATADGTAAAEFAAAFSPHDACPGSSSDRPAVLATDSTYPDALASAYLAKYLGTGTLLTPAGSLSEITSGALRTEGITHVYVVGGTSAVSTKVVSELEASPVYACGGRTTVGGEHLAVTRISGPTAYDTATRIAEYPGAGFVGTADLSGTYAGTDATGGTGRYNDTSGTGSAGPSGSGALPTAILASGAEFQDAEAAATLSYADRLPILLTASGSLSTAARSAIGVLHIGQVLLVGGPFAVSNAVVSTLRAMGVSVVRVAGKDYTDTAVQLAKLEVSKGDAGFGWAHVTGITVARGDFFTDGLAGAALDASGGFQAGPQPLLLTESPTTAGPYLAGFLRTIGAAGIDGDGIQIQRVTVLGGRLAVTTGVVSQIEGDLSS